ncbi:unnamed protein product (macronuclear) [Paramecium tetraurelia]|uniref:Arrestin C-terminal-like domain-containing protein n=1 Tax=Paramecium tetraurelia TaxID=5888 RepID=A0D012_PARTE|nr:uncharacterized protein GSPATT00011953001 [Paramecium tetraurelia]CAK76379.1 unnamed protein product [Paramecium tetraurelia]|eukprot:XP_001443776.1 hypothetical protein (macronuclear) [Paramecium tetraurelia strain d4-2]
MGNKSGSEFGGIMIRTEKSLYFAGDVVKGNIYLHIIKPGYHGNVVQFSIVGKEKTQWTTGSGKHRRTHYGKNVFHRDAVVINTFLDENLMVGQFVFPFELHLPSNLPGSFQYAHAVLASLNYKVKARVISTSKSINDIKNKQEIIIREPIKEILQVSSKQETANLTTWCCKKQGSSSISAKVEKNLYFPGEFVQITYDIDNSDCKLNIENVDVIIVNRLNIKSNSGSQCHLEFQLSALSQNGLQKGLKIQPASQIGCSLQLVNTKQPQIVLTPSTTGNFVNSSYYVKILPNFEGCTCCSSKPIVLVPITLLAVLPNDYLEPIQQPENWQPQAFQPLIIKSNNIDPFNNNNTDLKNMANPMNS